MIESNQKSLKDCFPLKVWAIDGQDDSFSSSMIILVGHSATAILRQIYQTGTLLQTIYQRGSLLEVLTEGVSFFMGVAGRNDETTDVAIDDGEKVTDLEGAAIVTGKMHST